MNNLSKFSVLAGSTVTSTGPTVVGKNVGVSPGSAITGFPPGIKRGSGGDPTAAMAELIALHVTLAASPVTKDLSGKDLGGMTLAPGVYKFDSSAEITGWLTLSGMGDFTFIIGSTLTTASGVVVELNEGAKTENVKWVVGSSATLGTHTEFAGDILADISATLTTGAKTTGSVWAIAGSVTLDSNIIG